MALSVGSGLWLFFTFAVFLFYFLVFFIFPKVELLSRLYLMGKLRGKESKSQLLSIFDVPKRWFSHFYMLGIVVNTTLIVLLLRSMFFKVPFPQEVQDIFHVLRTPNSKPESVPMTSIAILLVMEEIQVVRRCYECLYVSVFSDSRISIVHYIMGLLLYLTYGSCLLSSTDFHNFRLTGYEDQVDLVCVVIGCFIFILASMLQHRTFHIFAKLRKSHSGTVDNTQHLLPHGGLFDYISCPHFFTEIVIYLAMNIVVKFQHQACLSIGIFVLVNQVIMGLMTHDWYRKNFRMYPKHRKAVIPYLL